MGKDSVPSCFLCGLIQLLNLSLHLPSYICKRRAGYNDTNYCELYCLPLQAKLNETFDEVEEGYESSRDEISSVSSYNLMKEDVNRTFGSSLSLQSFAARSSTKGSLYVEGRTSISSNVALPKLAVAEVLHDSSDGILYSVSVLTAKFINRYVRQVIYTVCHFYQKLEITHLSRHCLIVIVIYFCSLR